MGLFKEVKKPVIKAALGAAGEVSPLRPLFVAKSAPCASGCPNGNEIRDVLTMIAQAKDYGLSTDEAFKKAWNRIVERNPFPAITGRVCPHPCEEACNRNAKDGAVAFHKIERMLGDFGIERNLQLPRAADTLHEQVAVVGAGSAGLSCAYQLARRGYGVTVFECLPLPGGMLRCIPGSRLQREVLDVEISRVLHLGIELRCNCRIGSEITLEQIRNKYDAVFVGTGAWQTRPLSVQGEGARNVMDAVDFLRRLNGGEKIEIGRKLVVVGAGPTAVDVAHASRLMGVDVTMVGAKVTASDHEVAAVSKEGVRVEAPAVVEAIVTENGHATVVRCAYLSTETRNTPNSQALNSSSHARFDLGANLVVLAIDRQPNLHGFETVSNGDGWFHVDDWGEVCDRFFAGGDNTGLGTVTRALAQGRLAAEAMIRQFQGRETETRSTLPIITPEKMKLGWYQPAPRELEPETEEHRLDAPDLMGWTEDAIVNEAKRCMSCGMCMDCESCWMYCTPNCFVRLPKGEHCRIKLELCNGCKKCAEACPTGYIEMV